MNTRPEVADPTLTIVEAQRDVRTSYAGGFHGQLVSAFLWLLAGCASVVVSHAAGMATLLIGGMLIFPSTTVLLRLSGRSASLPPGHPMAGLAMQIAFTVPLGLLVALVAAGDREEVFFPASMIIVGAHYLPFTFLYGMRLFAVLGSVLVAGGLTLPLRLPDSFSLGAWVTAGVLTVFAFLLRRSHLIREAHEPRAADPTTTDRQTTDRRVIEVRHRDETDRSEQRLVAGSTPPPQLSRRALLAAGAGLGTAGLLASVGPWPVGPAPGRSGDPVLLRLAEPHLRGLNRVALAYLDGDTTRYAGIGADEQTQFGIGSVSKTFCGAVLMDMVAAGEVRLDTTVGELTDADQSALAEVTLQELASHTSGLADFTASQTSSRNAWFGLLHADGALQDAVGTVTDVLGEQLEGRGSFSYSTAGIALLAHLLAGRAGTAYQELLAQRILTPLSLTGTSLPVTRAGLPRGWEKGLLGGRPAEPWTLHGLAPGGGMWSTCADLATWMRLTRDGHQPGAAGLQAVAPAPILPWLPDAEVAITWIRATTPAGEDLIFHNGLTGSHHAFVGFCPRTGRGLAYLVNSVPTGAQLLALQGDLVTTLLDDLDPT